MTGTMQIFYLALHIAVPAAFLTAVALYRYATYDRIDRSSIKYSIDHLPTGLMFYRPDGMPLLTNRAMMTIAKRMADDVRNNGIRLHAALFDMAKEEDAGQEDADHFVLRIGESVFSVTREALLIHGDPVIQLSAADVTELYRLREQLQEQNDSLKEAQNRLADYNKNAAALAASEEYLATKIRIHDTLGQVLLSTRYYLTESSASLTLDVVADNWIQIYDELVRARGEGAQTAAPAAGVWKGLQDAASVMGLTLILKGEFPEESVRLARMIVSCARVCMTNAVRHGQATEMTIEIGERNAEGRREIVFSNNGTLPPAGFHEGGGLTSLRDNVEKAGGSMRVETQDTFRVVILLEE